MNDETFCIYCQREYGTPEALRAHIDKEHAGTYADENVNRGLHGGRPGPGGPSS